MNKRSWRRGAGNYDRRAHPRFRASVLRDHNRAYRKELEAKAAEARRVLASVRERLRERKANWEREHPDGDWNNTRTVREVDDKIMTHAEDIVADALGEGR